MRSIDVSEALTDIKKKRSNGKLGLPIGILKSTLRQQRHDEIPCKSGSGRAKHGILQFLQGEALINR